MFQSTTTIFELVSNFVLESSSPTSMSSSSFTATIIAVVTRIDTQWFGYLLILPGSHIWLLSSFFGVLPSNGEGNNTGCPYVILARMSIPLMLIRVTFLAVVEYAEEVVDNDDLPSAGSYLITELI